MALSVEQEHTHLPFFAVFLGASRRFGSQGRKVSKREIFMMKFNLVL
jgi:hypothetical protein